MVRRVMGVTMSSFAAWRSGRPLDVSGTDRI
jgi:hypothetical protein